MLCNLRADSKEDQLFKYVDKNKEKCFCIKRGFKTKKEVFIVILGTFFMGVTICTEVGIILNNNFFLLIASFFMLALLILTAFMEIREHGHAYVFAPVLRYIFFVSIIVYFPMAITKVFFL